MSHYRDLVLSMNPKAYWRLGDSVAGSDADTMKDETGNFNGVYPEFSNPDNASSLLVHDPNSAKDFTVDSDRAEVTSIGSMNPGNSSFSFIFLTKKRRDDSRSFNKAIAWEGGTSGDDLIVDTNNGQGEFRVILINNGSVHAQLDIPRGEIDDNNIHLIVIQVDQDNGRIRLNLDGASRQVSPIFASVTVTLDVRLVLGASLTDGSPWEGIMDEVAYFERRLTNTEINNLWDAATIPPIEPPRITVTKTFFSDIVFAHTVHPSLFSITPEFFTPQVNFSTPVFPLLTTSPTLFAPAKITPDAELDAPLLSTIPTFFPPDKIVSDPIFLPLLTHTTTFFDTQRIVVHTDDIFYEFDVARPDYDLDEAPLTYETHLDLSLAYR